MVCAVNWVRVVGEHKLFLSVLVLMMSGLSSSNPPFIDIAHNMRILKLPNNTKVDSLIYRLKGTDADNDVIQFGVRGIIGNRLLYFKNVSFYEADVYLKMPLDIKESPYKVTLFASDPSGNFTEVESTIIVTESPIIMETPFVYSDHIIQIPEDTQKNHTIATISVRHKESNKLPVTFELRGSDHFQIKYTLGPEGTSNAHVYLVKPVDYEKQNLHVLTILALNAWTNETYDTRNIATIDKVVAVIDIQDSPPVFNNLPNVLEISENTRVPTIIHTFSAEDSDYGNQRNVTYDIDHKSPLRSYFGIDERMGSLVLRRPVQDIKQEIGVKEPMVLSIMAIEEKSEDDKMPALTTEVKVAIVIVSTDNERPHFKNDHLIGTIDENSQLMTPVRWQGMSSPMVTDDDPGLNGTIVLSISDPSDTFMIQPTRGINQILFSIIVKDNAKLDYEINAEKKFDIKITANDQSPYIQMSSTIFCTINLQDVNDNIPQFSQRVYEVELAEDAAVGTTLIKIEATDADTGDFGRIRFTSINGPLSNDLKIDAETGVIVLINNRSLDRETISEYRISVEARDELGRGNANVTEVHIVIKDANDNEPTFLQPRYDSVLNPDRFSFTQPLRVKAIDRDEPGHPNSNVSYEITGGNYLNKFAIDEYSGEITLKSVLVDDRNFRIGNEYQSIKFLPAFVLQVRAHDRGIPIKWSEVPVYIHNPDFLNRSVTFVIGDNERNVVQRKESIESGMSSLSGAEVHIYSIKPQDSNKELTEVLAWMAYPSQSAVDLTKSSVILSQITGKPYDWAPEPRERVSTASFGGTDMRVLIWLLTFLILATILFLIGFAVCWFCCCRKKTRREKLKDVDESRNLNTSVNDSTGPDKDKWKERRHKKQKKRHNHALQAWHVNQQGWESSLRPSSAPNNEQEHYMNNIRVNSSQSFQDQYLHSNNSFYKTVPIKASRHQRVRVGPQYHDWYNTNEMPIHSRLSDYHSLRTQTNPMRTFKGVDNMGYLRSTKEPVVIDDLNEEHTLHRTRASGQHLPYSDKMRTIPKRTEILYIQSPTIDANEELFRSVSQNEVPYVDDRHLGQTYDQNMQTIESLRDYERSKALTKAKARHVIFNEHNVSDMVIPEEGVVPGMVPKDGTQHNPTIQSKPSISDTNNTEKPQQFSSDSHQRVQIVSDSRDYSTNDDRIERNALVSDQRVDEKLNQKSILDYSPYGEARDETLKITSVSGVPVSIELRNGRRNVSQRSATNESAERDGQKSVRTKRGLVKENSVNSDNSYDSDSGIGKTVPNPKIELDIKNSGFIEKKSIFTIAYNDVKTRHLQSAESITE